jgi:hypothetical protein
MEEFGEIIIFQADYIMLSFEWKQIKGLPAW